MLWFVTLIVVTFMAALSLAVRANALRFGLRVGREVQAFWPAQPSAAAFEASRLDQVPELVQRYLRKAIAHDHTAVATAHLTHGGKFRSKLDGAWLPIRGTQYIRAEPPAFVWWGRVRVGPGVWIDARDYSKNGHGHMLVLMDSTFTLADSSGSEVDQGALLRLLAEMVWIPTELLEPRVIWTRVGERRAQARLLLGNLEVSGVFEFGDDDLPTGFRAMRYRDVGRGKAVLTEFYGSMSDYRGVNGLLVPHLLIAHWKVGEELVPYARFEVEQIEYDQPLPESADLQ
jgi:hypothetical protein